MSRWYRFLYRIGFTPWEQDSQALAPQIRALIESEQARREPPYGAALDLGCGTGRWSIELARRGWRTVGVDVVPKAIDAARERARAAGVDVTFVEGDVTALRGAGIASGFSLLLDVECFNHLTDNQREAMGQEVDSVASADASLLLLVWTRARRGPLPPGASREDLKIAFPGCVIVDDRPYEGELPRPLRNVALVGTACPALEVGPVGVCRPLRVYSRTAGARRLGEALSAVLDSQSPPKDRRPSQRYRWDK